MGQETSYKHKRVGRENAACISRNFSKHIVAYGVRLGCWSENSHLLIHSIFQSRCRFPPRHRSTPSSGNPNACPDATCGCMSNASFDGQAWRFCSFDASYPQVHVDIHEPHLGAGKLVRSHVRRLVRHPDPIFKQLKSDKSTNHLAPRGIRLILNAMSSLFRV